MGMLLIRSFKIKCR